MRRRRRELIALIILIFAVALSPIPGEPFTQSLNDDILGLIVFKADVQDPDARLASWNEDADSPCSWEGVGCSPRSNRVTELVLDGFSLSGHIGRGLLQLQSLRKLSLARNNLSGTISPALITKLPNLRFLDLSENSLSGPLSGDFFRQCGSLRAVSLAGNKLSGPVPGNGYCSSLESVNFSFNQFSGSLPSSIIWSLPGLRSLDLSRNSLDGEIPPRREGGGGGGGGGGLLPYNLRSIDLSGNKLTGNVPDDIGTSLLLLKSIDLSNNLLSGNLPTSLSNLTSCRRLSLGRNSLTGEIPGWIGEMRALETLDLSANNFSGSTVPDSIGNLKSLQVLILSANGLRGSLPESMVNCARLRVLDMSENSLEGDLPKWISQLGLEEIRLAGNKLVGSLDVVFPVAAAAAAASSGSKRLLRVVDLSGNDLSGSITSSVGEASSVQVLNVSRNRLNGSIPAEIGDAAALNELVLDDNAFEGSIPDSIQQCSELSVVTLSRNEFDGPIPASLSKLTHLKTIDLSFNKLTGSLPKQLSGLSHLSTFNISHNNFQGELPSGGFFNTIPLSSVAGNPSLCGTVIKRDCSTVLPKPIVLNPNSTTSADSSTGPPIPPTFTHKRIILSISSLVAIGAAALIFVGVIAVAVLNFRVRASSSKHRLSAPGAGGGGGGYALSGAGSDDLYSSNNSPSTDAASSGKLVVFSGGELNFSTGTHALLNKDCELGRGGFGAVYRTVLGDGKPVAIKKLTVSSLVKSQHDFEREVKKLGKIRHPNVVELNGYYWTPSLQLLIYEFVSGGSLHKHLHESKGNNNRNNINHFLSWNDRFSIILGMAKGLSHLHQQNMIHYNLKSSNILVSSSSSDNGGCQAKVGDYGLARLLPMLDRYVLSSKIQSALGYMAPEFACRTVKITQKCDVYGFGVLVLEVVTGKRPVEYMEDDVIVLCDMVRGALDEGRVEECIDAKLQGPAEEVVPVIKLGLICTSQVPSSRPDMKEVVKILEMIRCPDGVVDDESN